MGLREDFEAYHAANPRIYRGLRLTALEMVKESTQPLSIKVLWMVTQEKLANQTKTPVSEIQLPSEFYLNFYADLLVQDSKLEDAIIVPRRIQKG